MNYALSLLGLLALMGCQSGQGLVPQPVADGCGADGYQGLVGTNLAAISMPSDLNTRIIKPGQAVTTDFYADRLNIRVDKNGVIKSLSCG